MRVVIDTNILISASVNKSGTPRKVVDWIFQYAEFLMSNSTFDEFLNVMNRKFIFKYLTHEEKNEFIQLVKLAVDEMVIIQTNHHACKDEQDNIFFDLAVAGRAEYILSGDRLVKEVGSFQGIPVVSCRVFYDTVITPVQNNRNFSGQVNAS